jgi:hypothetical protein
MNIAIASEKSWQTFHALRASVADNSSSIILLQLEGDLKGLSSASFSAIDVIISTNWKAEMWV